MGVTHGVDMWTCPLVLFIIIINLFVRRDAHGLNTLLMTMNYFTYFAQHEVAIGNYIASGQNLYRRSNRKYYHLQANSNCINQHISCEMQCKLFSMRESSLYLLSFKEQNALIFTKNPTYSGIQLLYSLSTFIFV